MNFALPPECTGAGIAERLAAFALAAGFDPAQIANIYAFGYTPEVIDQLAELVVSGPKRATTSLLRWHGPGGEHMPIVGDRFIVVGSGCVPRAVVRITRVDVKPFRAIDADDAWDEGEGDRSLAYWRSAHRDFFEAEGARAAFTFREDDEVVFCRFELLSPRRSS
ncbi:MAG: ASCH domain-containing protein [Candidatus Eremiobacteraeota bacterium]|nr:ASCH domain-containing protein [Candidatus Eremiobacteraeota bacterium]